MIDFQILHGDALMVLKTLADESVQTCVTSPPYYGLRDYGIDGQIGLEETPEMFVSKMVEVFREVRRVLKKDGTCWVNLGDSYAGSGRGRDADGTWNPGQGGAKQETNKGATTGRIVNNKSFSKSLIEKGAIGNAWVKPPAGYKAKDLMGMPWRVAFALQTDGWWLRQDIIWSKPNPMPESVTDRCTKAHEYIFLLSKSAKYFFDSEAIKEPSSTNDIRRPYGSQGAWKMDGRPEDQRHGGQPRRDSWKESEFHSGKTAEHQLGRSSTNRDRSLPRNRNGITGSLDSHVGENRNKRSVWTVSTQPYSEAHFATFPEKLIEPCILAGSREGDTVLDPFSGAGTTGLVSLKHKRKYIGIELNPDYIAITQKRLREVQTKLFV